MSQAFFSVLKRFFAYILSLLAVLNLSPNKSEAPDDGGSDSAPYVFSSAEDYSNYYFYCLEETPEPYTWSPEALAARDNVERVCSAEGFSVTLFKNKTARINALNGPVRDVVIPAEVEGYPVVAVFSILPWRDSDNASKIAAAVKSVVIPNTVEYIMDGAFEDLSNLRSVRFGNRVRYMEANAFRDCTCLTGVILPDSLDSVPAVAFSGCCALTEVTFGKNVRFVGRYAFDDCPCLRKVTLPETVTVLETYCFFRCGSMTYIYIPSSVTTIERNAFARCDRLTIHGEKGSCAESHAAENGIPFKQGR